MMRKKKCQGTQRCKVELEPLAVDEKACFIDSYCFISFVDKGSEQAYVHAIITFSNVRVDV